MNLSKKILLSCLISIAVVACSEDEDDNVKPSNNGSATLTGGTWEAFEFKDSKGVTYGINEWVPEYDTINGCEVVEYEEKTVRDEISFSSSEIYIDGEWEEHNRTMTNMDTSCNATYTPWTSGQFYSYSDTMNYKISGSDIIIWDDSLSNSDTIPYAIRNGLLYIDEGTEDEYIYRKK